MIIRFLDIARHELDEAVLFHDRQLPGLGKAFLAEVLTSLDLILRHPTAWHPLSEHTRRCRLRRFPYGLIYHANNLEILIIAVAHLHRRPDYWRDRLAGEPI